MEERIIHILRAKKLSASQFADAIGMQRSSISHVMSGRNKPSMDFMQKILNTFPDINAEYLLMGEGPVLKEMDLFTVTDKPKEEKKPANVLLAAAKSEAMDMKTDETIQPTTQISQNKPQEKPREMKGKIERIVFFYDNGHFDVYIPGKEDIP